MSQYALRDLWNGDWCCEFQSTGCSIQNATLFTAHEHLQAYNKETNGNIKYLQPFSFLAADALLEICMALI
jgi:hypothetical protein